MRAIEGDEDGDEGREVMPLTLSGKNNGNQLSMSLEIWSLREGCILSPTSPYSIASKYPANPCKTPACGI